MKLSIEHPSSALLGSIEWAERQAYIRRLQGSIAGLINATTCVRDARSRFTQRQAVEWEKYLYWMAL
jgi:hypothetical protein